jgi:phage baseplate assembly protein W
MASTNIKKFYKGFSTRNYHDLGKEFEIYNVDCVTEDLLNHIFTIKGERVMMPDFGTRIPLMVFEPNDELSQEVIRDDLLYVFKYDPRVELLNLVLNPDEDTNLIEAIATLKYLEFDVVKDLHIEIRSQ